MAIPSCAHVCAGLPPVDCFAVGLLGDPTPHLMGVVPAAVLHLVTWVRITVHVVEEAAVQKAAMEQAAADTNAAGTSAAGTNAAGQQAAVQQCTA